MRCDICDKPMFSWNEESWGRVEKVYECTNPNCGHDEEEENEDDN